MATLDGTVAFFANQSELPQQAAADGFGPISDTEYNLTSVFTGAAFSTHPMAHAVTDGKLFLVKNVNTAGGERVNLVLKPEGQILGMPRIKYFIYRGLLKSDFLDANNGYSVIKPQSTNDSDLITKIRKQKSGQLNALKVYATLWEEQEIDIVLLINGGNFQTVKKGESLGRFDGTAGFFYGFEIVLDEPGFSPTVADAMKDRNKIEILTNDPDEYKKRLKVINYIDPSAFYGSVVRPQNAKWEKVSVVSKYTVTFQSIDSFYYSGTTLKKESWSFNSIYENLLSKFTTSNKIYIDIRDKYNLPINFIGDFGNKIKLTTDSSVGAISTAGVDYPSNSWPIHIIDGQNSTGVTFSNNESFNIRWANNNKQNSTYNAYIIRLSLPKGLLTNPLLYLKCGQWKEFLPTYNLTRSPLINLSMLKFGANTNSDWTEDIEVAIPGIIDTNSTEIVISSYIRADYIEYINIKEIYDQIPDALPLEVLFDSLEDKLSFNAVAVPSRDFLLTAKTLFGSTTSSKYVSNRGAGCLISYANSIDYIGQVHSSYRSLSHFLPKEHFEYSAHTIKGLSYNNKEIRNINKTKFETTLELSSASSKKENSFYKYLENTMKFEFTFAENVVQKIDKPVRIHFVEVEPGVKCLEFRILDGVTIRGRDLSPFEPFYSVAYSLNDYLSLIEPHSTCFSGNGQIFIKLAQSTLTIQSDERDYIKAELLLKGLVQNGQNWEWIEEHSGLFVYSLDGYNYTSADYAENYYQLYPDTVWNNKLIPQLTQFPQAVQSNLQTLLESIGGVDKRLLLGELRDHLFAGDLAKLTFEIAFRLPFFCEKTKPHLLIDSFTHNSNSVDIYSMTENIYNTRLPNNNNPYIDYFNHPTETAKRWYAAANSIRTSGGLEELTETGNTTSTAAKSVDHVDFYDVMELKSVREDINNGIKVFQLDGVDASMAGVMNHENPFLTNGNQMTKTKPHFSVNVYDNTGSPFEFVVDTDPVAPRDDLAVLQTNGILAVGVANELKSLSYNEFGYAPVEKVKKTFTLNGSSVTLDFTSYQHFIFKRGTTDASSTEKSYKIKSSYVKEGKSSSITVGFGLDIGQNSLDTFKTYTQYNESFTDINGNTLALTNAEKWKTVLEEDIKKITVSSGTASTSTIDKLEIVKDVSDEKSSNPAKYGNDAISYLKTFEDDIWNKLEFNTNHAIKYFQIFMKQYWGTALINIKKTRTLPGTSVKFLKVYKVGQNNLEFYEPGGYQFMNQLEKLMLLTMPYNHSFSDLNLDESFRNEYKNRTPAAIYIYRRGPCLLVHAINTHDIRWLREYVIHTRVYPSRKVELLKLLKNNKSVNHYYE